MWVGALTPRPLVNVRLRRCTREEKGPGRVQRDRDVVRFKELSTCDGLDINFMSIRKKLKGSCYTYTRVHVSSCCSRRYKSGPALNQFKQPFYQCFTCSKLVNLMYDLKSSLSLLLPTVTKNVSQMALGNQASPEAEVAKTHGRKKIPST